MAAAPSPFEVEAARHQRIKELFDAACSEPGSERFAFVARECGGDEAMRRELESLLAFYEDGGEPADGRPRRVRARRDRESGGRTIAGRYRIERRLGAGGMGEVYAAYDGLMREEVALKLFPHADHDERRRLVEEVRLARLVTHPAVCRVYDLGEDAGTVFLTMQLIDGEDLAGRLSRSGALPSSEVASIGRTLADALAAAHEAGVLHRDLKPSNVLIGRDGKVHIADFGIATRNSAQASGESGERRFGTLAYMAPEETIGGVATQQTDLYSLGLVLYELLTGAPAFEAADKGTLLELRRSARIERPSILVRDADADLEALILQLLEDDPAQRPESARAVATALGGLTLATTGEPAAEAERRQIVALSCELEARPDLVAGGRWAEIVRTFQARCSASCRRRGGRVARHLPRGLLVYFGLPRRAEQDAEQAVQAGLEILADLSARPLLAPGMLPPAVSIGVDAPVVSVRGRNVVSRGRTITEPSPGATGSSAVSNRVVVTGAVQPLLRSSFVTTSLASSAAEPSYLISQAPQPVVLNGDGVRLTPFVGRELELERLTQCWRDARSGSGQIALVSGEPGIGKTRLVRELWQRVRGDGGTLYEARCSSLHSHTPLHPFVEMVSQLAGLSTDDDAETRTAKLRRTVAPFGARADSLLGVFSAWLPIGPSTARAPSTRHDRRAAIAAIEDCVVTLSELHPLVLVCEDLHWSDPTTREAIERLVDAVRTARILLVLTFRRDFEPRWSGTGIHHLALQPLREDEARGMVSLFPEVEGRPEIVMRTDELVDRADGNPLFLEELTRHALETVGTSQQQSVPGSLKGLLSARLDRLGSARRLAQAASVCGRSVSYLVLAGLVSETESVQFENDLSRLIDGEILLQRGPSTRATFTFRHALLREAAYEALPLRERRRLHALAARALPELDPQSVSQPELVASHWAAAKQDDLAFSWWRRAGFLALERSAYAEAKYHLERALRALPSAVAEAERDAQKLEIELALTALEAGRNGPGSNEAARHARRAEALCARLPPGDQVARALMLSGRVRYARGEMRISLRMLEPLWAVEDTIADPYLRAAVLTQAGNLLSTLGRLEESERFQERAIAMYARAEQRPAGAFTTDPLAHLMVTRAADDWLRGRATQSRRWLDAAIEHADRLAHPFTRALVRMLGASLALRQGDREHSSRLLEEGAALAVAVESSWLINMAEVYSPVLDRSLSPAEAARRIEDALDRTSGSWVLRSLQWSELARMFENAGRPEDATRAMDRALREARRRDRSLVPEILRRRGELMAGRGDHREARAALRSAVKLARRERTFGLELLAALSLARLLLDQGRAGEARRALAATLAGLPDDVTAPERARAAALLAGIQPQPPGS